MVIVRVHAETESENKTKCVNLFIRSVPDLRLIMDIRGASGLDRIFNGELAYLNENRVAGL